MFSATTHAPAVIAQENRNSVHVGTLVGVAKIAGGQTRRVNTLSSSASSLAAKRGTIENRTPMPAAICAAPVM